MIIFRKARRARQTKNDLDAYLTLNGGELTRWLAREVQSWGEYSYSELENLIMTGGMNDIIDWQSRWAEVINETFTPAWLAAMTAAAIKATKGKIILDDSDVDVKNFLRTHGGELITVLSEESKKAVAMVILRGQAEKVLPKKIAQQIRPLIGLNQRQTQANMTYRERVYQNLLSSGLPPVTASARADKAALRYAGKQHRERADMIVNTELAFAYNRGADIGIKRAIKNGYMSRCEMVWTTAGTNRVCPRCLALKDKVVGHTDEDGVTLPPLHPRCRCAIMYREVGTRNNPSVNDNVKPATATGISGVNKPLTPQQIKAIRDAEEAAFKAKTGEDFGFKKMKVMPDWSKEIMLTNPRGEYGYTQNCQRCVVAHEARMRGYDVIARPSWGANDTLRQADGWINAFGSHENFKICAGQTGEEVIESAKKLMQSFGEGARAIIVFEWNKAFYPKGSGHAIVAQCREKGIVVFGDPQTGERAASRKLKLANYATGVILLRVDNLNFSETVKRCCRNKE